ncbi:MAG: hypothetical protein ACM308_01100 [Qipengyuania vulgaris]
MSKAVILYVAASMNLIVGVWLLVGLHPEFVAGEVSTFQYVARGIGPLILSAAFIFLARKAMAKESSDDA